MAPLGPLTPRLLDLEGGAHYCGVSTWTFKEWLRTGVVKRVPLPARLLRVDREDLDELVREWKRHA